jgi:hypothetical protein
VNALAQYLSKVGVIVAIFNRLMSVVFVNLLSNLPHFSFKKFKIFINSVCFLQVRAQLAELQVRIGDETKEREQLREVSVDIFGEL